MRVRSHQMEGRQQSEVANVCCRRVKGKHPTTTSQQRHTTPPQAPSLGLQSDGKIEKGDCVFCPCLFFFHSFSLLNRGPYYPTRIPLSDVTSLFSPGSLFRLLFMVLLQFQRQGRLRGESVIRGWATICVINMT